VREREKTTTQLLTKQLSHVLKLRTIIPLPHFWTIVIVIVFSNIIFIILEIKYLPDFEYCGSTWQPTCHVLSCNEANKKMPRRRNERIDYVETMPHIKKS